LKTCAQINLRHSTVILNKNPWKNFDKKLKNISKIVSFFFRPQNLENIFFRSQIFFNPKNIFGGQKNRAEKKSGIFSR